MAEGKNPILTEEEIAAMHEEYIALNMEAERTAELQARKEQGAPIYEEKKKFDRSINNYPGSTPDGTNIVVYFTRYPVGAFALPNVIGEATVEFTIHTTKMIIRNIHVSLVGETINLIFPNATSINGQVREPIMEISGPILNVIKQKIYTRL